MELHLPPKPTPTVLPGEFRFAAAGLAHGHIYGMVNGLLDAGAELVGVWDEDLKKVSAFQSAFPQAHAASCLDELLDAHDISLIVSAAGPSERWPLGRRVMAETGRKYMVYYSERLHNEAATLADELIRRGEIGRVLHMEGFGPHRLGNARPDWFYQKACCGGILCDIGSHQLEQFLYFTGAEDSDITFSRKANYAHPGHPEFEDFGECTAAASNGATGYFRVDWFTPDGLRRWTHLHLGH